MRFLTLLTALLAFASLGVAQAPPLPPNVKIDEKLGAQVPLDLQFKDEQGKDVKLGDYFGKKPVALLLIFYKCGGTCLTELKEATTSFRALKTYDIGRDFEVVTVSIHPKEEPWLAKSTHDIWTDQYDRPTGKAGWHFLTGPEKASRALADSVGFYYEYLPKENTVRHPNALIVLTPEGKVSQYFKGLIYPQKLLLGALQMAQDGEIGESNPAEGSVACIQNPNPGKYTAIVSNLVNVAGVLFMVGLGGTVFVLNKKKNAADKEERPG